jgi:hypothetical protein
MLRERADEELAMRLDPFGMLVGELLHQVDGTHDGQPIAVVGQAHQLGDARRIGAQQRERLVGARNRSTVAVDQQAS